jgi:hypothetical protein
MGVPAARCDGKCVYLFRLAQPEDLERIRDFLSRGGLVVSGGAGGSTLRVSVPRAPTPLHELNELKGYVATWNALNPASPVELVARDE